MLLGKATTDPTSFITRKTAIGVEFLTKNPFTRNYVGRGRTRNKLPCVILKESGELVAHSGSPMGVKKSSFVSFRERRD